MTDTRKAIEQALPERDHSKPAEEQGLFRKFIVQRVDRSDQPGGKHHGCEYFVLDVDHDPHAKAALQAYAKACEQTHPDLSNDLRERHGWNYDAETIEPLRAQVESLRSALAQQGEQQEGAQLDQILDDALEANKHRAQAVQKYSLAEHLKLLQDSQRTSEALCARQKARLAAPAAQPTCKQELQVPTVKENLTVWVIPSGQFSWEPQDERYWVRMTPAAQPDWSLLEATQQSLREHMAMVKELQAKLAQQGSSSLCTLASLPSGIGRLVILRSHTTG